ncbi:unnamed protein product [Linum trigynum]|uniref:Uncharacterized protein n=1 Tax=Linum trigynum TaxID=586398 RepID=A0AAV2ECH9_9ROSI
MRSVPRQSGNRTRKLRFVFPPERPPRPLDKADPTADRTPSQRSVPRIAYFTFPLRSAPREMETAPPS